MHEVLAEHGLRGNAAPGSAAIAAGRVCHRIAHRHGCRWASLGGVDLATAAVHSVSNTCAAGFRRLSPAICSHQRWQRRPARATGGPAKAVPTSVRNRFQTERAVGKSDCIAKGNIVRGDAPELVMLE